MTPLFAAALFLSQAAPSDTDTTELLRRATLAAERSADAAERSARAAEAAAGIVRSDATAEPAPKKPRFTGTAGLAFTAMTGNSNALTGSLNVGLSVLIGQWTLSLKSLGAYGRSKAVDATTFEDNALNVSAEVKGARSLTDIVGVYALGGYGMDHVAKIDYRAYGEAGAEFTFFKRIEGDLVKLQLITDLGVRYQRESWYQFYATADAPVGPLSNPTPDIVAIRAGADFRYAINKNVVFNERLDVLPDVLTPQNLMLQSLTALNVKLVGPLGLTASFLLKYDNLPPPSAQKLDTILSLGADITF